MKRKVVWMAIIVMVVGSLFIMPGCAPAPAPEPTEQVPEAPVQQEQQTITWRLQSAYGEADLEYIALGSFVKAIEEKSGGQLKINIFSGGTIVPEEEQLEATARGVVEISHALGGYWRGTVPVGDVDFGLPAQYIGTLENFKHMLYEFEGGALAEIFREAYASQGGVYYFGSHSFHGYPVIISTVPIRSIEDMSGLVIRATGSYADLFEALGASTVFVPGGEMYTELQLGTIDAATWSIEGFLGYNWFEVAPYVMAPTISDHNTSHLLVNPAAWDALPDNLKSIIKEAYFEVFMPTLFQMYEDEWKRVAEKQTELGYEIVQMPEETIKEIRRVARENIWPQIAQKDDYTRRAVELIERWHNTYGN